MKRGGKSKFQVPTKLVLPEVQGGALPLIPIFAGLSALGALTGGISRIAKALYDVKTAKHQLEETTKHNKKMESLAMGKGLYLKPYKSGSGFCIHSELKAKKTLINLPI